MGGLFLFASALFFAAVMFGTGLAGKKHEPEPIEFAEPLEPPGEKARVLDKMWSWTVRAVLLVIIAYGIPIAQHISMERFGSRGLSPF